MLFRSRELAEDPRIEAAIGRYRGSDTYQTLVGGYVPFSQTLNLAHPELNQKFQQLKSSLIMSAQQKMKGLGPMSDADARRVEDSVGKLEKARNKSELINAISEIESSVQSIKSRALAAAKQFPQLGSRLSFPADAAAGNPLDEAKAAIAAGAPRDKVIERLRQNGIEPSGL